MTQNKHDTKAQILMLGDWAAAASERLAAFDLHRIPEADAPSYIKANGDAVQALIVGGHAHVDAAMLDQLPNLKIIGCFGVGYDGIDTAAAAARGAWVSNTPDVLSDDVADLAMGLMLSVVRRMPEVERYVRDGEWARRGSFALTDRLTGKRLGMLGMGRIGSAIVQRALGFDMQISYHATAPKDVPYTFAASAVELASACDILCVAMNATPQTIGIVNAEVLRALGADGYLVNISRGTLVDEPALIAALGDGVIKGAGLDVFANEPNIAPELVAMPNTALSAHQGSATVHTRLAMAALVADNVEAVLNGKPPLTPVNQPS